MNNIFEQINSIALNEILDAVWIHYDLHGTSLELYDGNVATDWWRWDTVRGFIKDFAWKWRAEWDRITFIMAHFWIEKWEAVTWYKDKFSLIELDSPKEPTTISNADILSIIWNAPVAYKINIKKKWDSLPDFTNAQREYLTWRWIDPDKIPWVAKNNNGYICCPIYDMTWMLTLQSRSILSDGPRFMIEKWTSSKWVFMHKIDKDKRYIYVVEGLMDYLSLVQFDSNVVWLKSATDWFEMVKEFYNRWYKIILIPDADEAWQWVIEKFNDIKYSLFDVGKYGVKDINDLLYQWWYGEKILDLIQDERAKEPINIDAAFQKFNFMKKRIKERWRLWFDWPFPVIDRYTQWVIEWKTYTIWAFSNTGKSQFSYAYVAHFLRQGKKIWYFSLEVDTWMLLSHVAKAFYKDHYTNIMMWSREVIREDFQNLFLYEDVFTIKDIHKITEMEKFDIIFIDYVQALRGAWSSSVEKFEDIALWIQRIWIETNCVTYAISQVNNESRNKDWNSVMLKWSGAFFAASDVVMILSESWSFLKLDMVKNKFWKKTSFIVNPIFETGEFHILQEAHLENEKL